MEEMALGEMGMTPQGLFDITPRSLFNKLYGFRRSEKDQWERTRAQTYILLSPYFKENDTVLPQDVFPLPWDGEILRQAKKSAEELAKERAELWAKIDARKSK